MLPGQSPKGFKLIDFFLLGFVALAAAYIAYRITVKLNYSWHWEMIPGYIVRFDPDTGKLTANYLLTGLLTTLKLSIWGSFLAFVLGLVAALARTSSSLLARMLSRSYIELMRNLPPLVIIFIFYFFLADQIVPLLGLDSFSEESNSLTVKIISAVLAPPDTLSPFISALVTLAAFEGAYVAEIIRSGLESVPAEQHQAAHALGLSRYQSLRYIILPQALGQVLPLLAGQAISLIKDSAIVSVISIQELTYQGTQLMASTYMTIEVWITIACLYMILTLPCSLIVRRLEKQLSVF